MSSVPAASERHFWETARIHFVRHLISRYHPQVRVIADIGCGDCAVLSAMAQDRTDARMVGVDSAFTVEMMDAIRHRLGIGNIVLAQNMDALADERADLLLLLDVAEHLEKPAEMLQLLRRRCADDALLIVTVPAFQYLYTDHDRFLKHFRRYNRRELCQLLSASGWDVLTSCYFFASLLPFRLLRKWRHQAASKEEALKAGNRVLNRIASWILKTDAEISFFCSRLGIFLPGLSCAAVAKCTRDMENH